METLKPIFEFVGNAPAIFFVAISIAPIVIGETATAVISAIRKRRENDIEL